MRPLFYLIVYGFFGFIVERIINIVFLGYYHDNSVLFLPVQPMYGLGVVITIYAYHHLRKLRLGHFGLFVLIMAIGISATMFSEHLSGTLYYRLYGLNLWDYRHTFSLCTRPYTCIIPSSLFGVLSVLTVVFIHPWVELFVKRIPQWLMGTVIVIVLIDYILTYGGIR